MRTLSHNTSKIRDQETGGWKELPALVGESAYEAAIRLGKFSGTEEEWADYLVQKRNEAVEAASQATQAAAETEEIRDDISTYADQAKQEALQELTAAGAQILNTAMGYKDTSLQAAQEAVSAKTSAAASAQEAAGYLAQTKTLSVTNVGNLELSVNAEKNCLQVTYEE